MPEHLPSEDGKQAYELLLEALGRNEGAGDWFQIDQARINAFADATEDHQFIHVDPQQCEKSSPWGVPIAHGFLTLSLLPMLRESIPRDQRYLDTAKVSINYGLNKVRFVSPVKVDSRVRARGGVSAVDKKDSCTLQITETFTVEIEGEGKPALVAEWVTRLVYD